MKEGKEIERTTNARRAISGMKQKVSELCNDFYKAFSNVNKELEREAAGER